MCQHARVIEMGFLNKILYNQDYYFGMPELAIICVVVSDYVTEHLSSKFIPFSSLAYDL